MNETKQTDTVHQRLAEAVLQNRLLEERLSMLQRMVSSYAMERANIYDELNKLGLTYNGKEIVQV